MKIAIVGAGNAGCAHASMFTRQGHDVNLIKTSNSLHDENFNAVLEQQGIYYEYNNEVGFSKLNLVTRDLGLGLSDVDAVVLMTQTLQHEKLSKLILDNLSPSTKYIFVIPGYLGSLYFSKAESVTVIEGESTPYDARIIEPGRVRVLFQNVRNAIGVLRQCDADKALSFCQSLVPTYCKVRSNIVESALHNPNLVVHTIGAIMSASRIEYSSGEFWMYKEAFTPAIWNLIEQLDSEKNRVISYFKGVGSPYVEECKFRNERDLEQNAMDVFKSYAMEGGPKGPDSVNTRYIYEDVPMGLVLLESLASYASVETPIATSLINIAGSLLGVDFRDCGRTLDSFNIYSLNELVGR
ncbi:hypothetical protein A3K86_13200 [Photobacterium jeanii]|uniref:2-dehydropantoate 2-reductase n=1 Tax=Photobacterium jeanii TaxID=858640 RepID=A0A178K880_9GAMM|nr:NAD/NADP octopine/nopaline dehydrogenase family protein [Photobacterium jeanii]OAN13539.1 hypothetical protein A3K86_13200 [Photobacterium jeanii]PST88654.1 NAD/NADP octopine/nopaline dehydrogenase [Photobacterium jeanii]